MNKNIYVYNGEKHEFEVKTPTLTELMTVVEETADATLSEIVGFQPLLFDFTFKIKMIEVCTNVEIPHDFIDECYEFIEATEIHKAIISVIGEDKWNEVYDAAVELVDYRLSKDIEKTPLNELLTALTGLINTFQKEFDGLDMKDITDKFGKIISLSEKFNQEEILNMIRSQDRGLLNVMKNDNGN